MKTLKNLIPAAFFTLAVIGAFSTHAMNTTKKVNATTTAQGYFKGNPQGSVCNIAIECILEDGPICTSGGVQVWGMDANDKCLRELHKID